ncbi:hypothetical protein EDB85DRAFT_1897363 [Lactarius pseudohatsudake]|nr:hypothetical protein EDB85DRAFT_1897363 [Lactarius pseudohatsudake]
MPDHATKNAPSWASQVGVIAIIIGLASVTVVPASCCPRRRVTVVVGVVAVGVARRVGVALRRLLRAVRGGGGGGLVRGDGLEAAATGLCAARWRRRRRQGLRSVTPKTKNKKKYLNIMGRGPQRRGVGAKGQGVDCVPAMVLSLE